jgi:23S rRNA (pseudouridine1915-N3)-methyltransferase
MRITIVAVGRLKAGPERTLADHFRARLAWPVDVREVEEKRKLPPDALRRREAELLLAACPGSSVVVALDESGRTLTSRQFADRVSDWQDQGAALVLSLGPMTWPHFLVRGLLFEQLYRAQQIIAGHPYHRD